MADIKDISDEQYASYKEAFRVFDENGDGDISTQELGAVLKNMYAD